ncbi:hypothetical protein HMPREF1979_02957 [Actinomyces johnsonii F0542]|uniref:Uncharacterized protein n=1 Tax=Actinomyces johnsonii F0542 TaxID=1321818 RepID=U1QIL9_9ACTO|nr:hypothetical protein HMPREF1979_02957 [Actinomyces johnsonii F0542]
MVRHPLSFVVEDVLPARGRTFRWGTAFSRRILGSARSRLREIAVLAAKVRSRSVSNAGGCV